MMSRTILIDIKINVCFHAGHKYGKYSNDSSF